MSDLQQKTDQMVETVTQTSQDIVDTAIALVSPYIDSVEESVRGDSLALGGTATYAAYTVTVDEVSSWSGGTRVHVVIEATGNRKVKVSWFEGVDSLGSIAAQDTTGDQDQQLMGTLQTTKGSTIEGYIYYKADDLQALRFSGGALQSDRVWTFA